MNRDDSALTPTEDLCMEVLAARVARLGEPFWPFPRNPTVTKALRGLEDIGYVAIDFHNVPDAWRVYLTDAGRAACTSDTYQTPAERAATEGS